MNGSGRDSDSSDNEVKDRTGERARRMRGL